jgi:hypothetical protein
VTTAPIVPCSEPHDSEAYTSIQLPYGDYAVGRADDEACYDAFESFAGIAWEDSVYEYGYCIHSMDSWNNPGDREVLCTIYDVDRRTTGSLENVGQ